MTEKTLQHETDRDVLRDAIIARLPHRSTASGQIRWPAIPALLDHYTQTLGAMFAGLGRAFDAEELSRLRDVLAGELALAFEASPFSKIVIDYQAAVQPSTALHYQVSHRVITLDDEYAEWVDTRQPPLFGAHPDAKVLSLARSLGPPNTVAVLDVGAGTGRNALPLAREGFAVDAVELASSLAAVLRQELERTGVSANVFEGDALDPSLPIPLHKYQLVVLAEVVASHFRDVVQLRRLFERASHWLAPGGLLLFSGFIATGEYEPDLLARQASQVFWCCLFTRRELDEASRGWPFARVSDESTYQFERTHLASDAWPPTGWFEQWASGRDLFELPTGQPLERERRSVGRPPHELRWLVYRKTDRVEADPERWRSVTVSQRMRAARARAFNLVAEGANAALIFKPFLPLPGIAERSPLTAAELAVGIRREVRWTDDSRTSEELLEYAPPFRIRYRWRNTLRGPLAWLMDEAESDWTFTETPSGSVVYWTYRFRSRTRLLNRVLNIVQGAFQRWMRRSLAALRTLVEDDS